MSSEPHHPDYYQGKGGMVLMDIIDAFDLDWYEGTIFKYVLRWRKKNGVDDLLKAKNTIDHLIQRKGAAYPGKREETGAGFEPATS